MDASKELGIVYKHGRQKIEFRDTPMRGKSVVLHMRRQRFRCTFCEKTFAEATPAIHGKRMMTKRLVDYIVKRCFQGTNMAVAREIGIDEGTIRNVFDDWVAMKQAEMTVATPTVLGIDEVHMADVRCVLTNIETRTLFDILPSRAKSDLRPYFDALSDKTNVETIVADMWRPYHDLAKEFFPGVPTVVDRFHIVRMAVDALDEVRKDVARGQAHVDRIRLKDDRFLLFKRSGNLSEIERARIRAWLGEDPRLKLAYTVKERFSDAFEERTRQAGERAIDKSIQMIPASLDTYFGKLVTAVGNWKPQILNFFERRVTNRYTESVNGLIREIDRNGRGYSFPVIRARMLFDETKRVKKTSTQGRVPAFGGRSMFDDHEPGLDPGIVGFMVPRFDVDVARTETMIDYGPSIEALTGELRRENDESGT